MQRVVLDTDVIVAGLRSVRGASNALLVEVALGRIEPLMSAALILEYESVLKRPEQRIAHGLSLLEIDRFLGAFATAARPVELSFRWRPQLTDTDDEMVFEAALNGGADALVTHNVRHFSRAAPRFGLRVVKPGEFLKELKS